MSLLYTEGASDGIDPNFSLVAQIQEVEREIALRETVYPGLIARGKMKEGAAGYHLGRLRSVRKTLLWLAANDKEIRAWDASRKKVQAETPEAAESAEA